MSSNLNPNQGGKGNLPTKPPPSKYGPTMSLIPTADEIRQVQLANMRVTPAQAPPSVPITAPATLPMASTTGPLRPSNANARPVQQFSMAPPPRPSPQPPPVPASAAPLAASTAGPLRPKSGNTLPVLPFNMASSPALAPTPLPPAPSPKPASLPPAPFLAPAPLPPPPTPQPAPPPPTFVLAPASLPPPPAPQPAPPPPTFVLAPAPPPPPPLQAPAYLPLAPPLAPAAAPLAPTIAPTTTNPGAGPMGYGAQYQLEQLSRDNKPAWELIVGLFFQESGRSPMTVGAGRAAALTQTWVQDLRRMDELERNPQLEIDKWVLPAGLDRRTMEFLSEVSGRGRSVLEAAIQTWAIEQAHRVQYVLTKAGWELNPERQSPAWYVMDGILKMPDGKERDAKLAQAKAESPRYFQYCLSDFFCGMRSYTKKTEDDPNGDFEEKYTVRAYRVPGQQDLRRESGAPKRILKFNMSSHPGQPTQFHGVPPEERAVDSKGNRLPWALAYPEGHPSARGQKRHPEEKGPFGKSSRRKGSSRTRTATPAKKENPTIDAFEKAMKYDAKKNAEAQQEANARAQSDGSAIQRQVPSHTKEPTQIIIYGYATSRVYAAIDLYEKVSGGMICEDYDREPPSQFSKYQNTFTASRSVHSRPLTKQEKAMAFKYDGGSHWIKLTCDSAEAAARAVESSPLQSHGYWVYAELYNGNAPEPDQPIPITDEDRQRGQFNSPVPPRRSSQTLPRSFNPNAMSQAPNQPAHDGGSLSPSTASSATATGPQHPNLRNRRPSQTGQIQVTPAADEILPGVPRYILRPASEAFLPQPTWWERQVQWLASWGLIPTDFIGDGLPVLENGEFDWAKASWYWSILYWIDTHFGTDICGLKEN